MNNFKLIYEEYACWGCKACEVACKQEYNQLPFDAYSQNGRDSNKYVFVWANGPRYLDDKLYFMWRVNVCRHCNEPICAKACPEVAITKDTETGIVLHDKEKCNGCNAIQGKSGAEKQETSPCKVKCPAQNNIQGIVSLAARGEYRAALELLKETNPFPSICGRICHHPCESDCNRKQIDEPLSIRSIERFLADQDFLSGKPYVPTVKEARNEKIAIIGSGPTGLSAAYFLARDGYQVTVFEKMPIAGGMMAIGIPEYRLPRDVTARDIKIIQDMGAEIKTGVTFGEEITLQNLKQDGYKAVFLAMGLQQNRSLNIDKEDMKGVLKGIDFLRDVALGNPISIGKRIVVIGGGNVAIDVALTSLRKGAQEVSLVCLEQRDEMPAWEHEITEALEWGVKIFHSLGPNKFLEKRGKLFGVEFKRCIDVCDSSGAFNPKYDETDLTRLEADTVIVAIGQAADLSFAKKQKIVLSPEGYLKADPLSLQTSMEGVFAGGDVCYGPGTIVEAIGSGREAAISIDRYIRGLSLTADRDLPLNPITKPLIDRYDPASRAQMPRLDPEVWVKNFAEVQLGFTEEMVLKEAKRCISCGTCCIQACPYHAISFNVNSGKTEKCNLCYNRVIHGLYPACADNICLAHCIYFGDPIEIEKKILEKRNFRGGWGEIIPKALINSRQ